MMIGRYFILKQELEFTEFRMSLELKDKKRGQSNEYSKYKSLCNDMSNELNSLESVFQGQSDVAEMIRLQLLRVVKQSLLEIENIIEAGYYPSLNQNMTLRGYVFGKIRSAFKYTMTYEGGRGPNPQIIPSTQYWDYTVLTDSLVQAELMLEHTRFYSISDALICYYNLQDSNMSSHKRAIGYIN